eukprot:COSAG01_NODE_2129_length_8368_cov_15.044041_7_plen_88_part_00
MSIEAHTVNRGTRGDSPGFPTCVPRLETALDSPPQASAPSSSQRQCASAQHSTRFSTHICIQPMAAVRAMRTRYTEARFFIVNDSKN